LKQFFRFTIVSTKLLFRSREAVGWNMLFPTLLFLIYVTAFSGMYTHNSFTKEQGVADSLAKILAITFMSGGLFSLAISIAVMKEKGILKRYKITPVRPITLVMGLITRQLILMLIITVLLFALAIIIYNADLRGSLIDWILVALIGNFVFLNLGFVVAGLSRTNQGAAGIGNLLFMPMLFLSGATIPAVLFPDWLIKISKILPATHLNNLLSNVLFRGQSLADNLITILVLLGFGAVFVIIAAFLSRWN
jgi:ABC-2 type transport system permease protein